LKHAYASSLASEKETMARFLSVNVGLPHDIGWQGKTVHIAISKAPGQSRRTARRLDIDGDARGDLDGHGSEHRAVFVSQIDSYRYWQNHFRRSDFTYGPFGENSTVEGLPDAEVCIGNQYRVSEAVRRSMRAFASDIMLAIGGW
jgi:MOSC domain-containing protein YiiM